MKKSNFKTILSKSFIWKLGVLVGSSYLSQNWFFRSKNLVFYLTFCALQHGHSFIRIGEFRLRTYIGNLAKLSCSDSYKEDVFLTLISKVKNFRTCLFCQKIQNIRYLEKRFFYLWPWRKQANACSFLRMTLPSVEKRWCSIIYFLIDQQRPVVLCIG